MKSRNRFEQNPRASLKPEHHAVVPYRTERQPSRKQSYTHTPNVHCLPYPIWRSRWRDVLAQPVSAPGSCSALLNLETTIVCKFPPEAAAYCSTSNFTMLRCVERKPHPAMLNLHTHIVAKHRSETTARLLRMESATSLLYMGASTRIRSASLNMEASTVSNPPVEAKAACSTCESPAQ